jgi:alpha-beta hydrolase superfamily lysophospholipase
MAERLLRSRTFARLIAERAFVGNVKQLTQFLDSPQTKSKVLARVDEEIDDSTRIVIGHSLGLVVAYEYLCRYQPAGVELFVTFGSPLGIPNVIFTRLTHG